MNILERFWNKVTINLGENACWMWAASIDPKGYGRFDNQLAHKFAWQLYNGVVPHNMLICHTCDNPTCINPNHLFLGTSKDNTQDAMCKNRLARGKHHGLRLHPKCAPIGERNGQHKLTNDQVIEIRLLHRQNKCSQKHLSLLYNVSRRLIGMIINNKIWKHI